MKKCMILLLVHFIVYVMIGCSNQSEMTKLNVFKMKDFSEVEEGSKITLLDTESIAMLQTAFNKAEKQPGIVNMVKPEYKIEIGEEAYLLWVNEESGVIMNTKDTHTIFSLTEPFIHQVHQLVNDQYQVGKTEEEVQKGDFIYRLVTEKTEYPENEFINLYAELEYVGNQDEIRIYHAASPFHFPIFEKTRGYDIFYPMNEPLLSTTLKKGEPLREKYTGGGGYGSTDEQEYIAFMKQIMNKQFPAGNYIVNGYADFFIKTNNEEINFNLKAQVNFKVK